MIALLVALLLQIAPPGAFDCLGEMTTPTIGRRVERSAVIPADTWESLQLLEARDIWVGYDNGGFDIAPNPYPITKIFGIGQDGQDIEIWVWSAAGIDDLYIFPFPSMEQFADSEGNHYGAHPCGAFAVDAVDFWSAFIIDGDGQ